MGRRAERQRVKPSDSETDGQLTGGQTGGQSEKWDPASQEGLEG